MLPVWLFAVVCGCVCRVRISHRHCVYEGGSLSVRLCVCVFKKVEWLAVCLYVRWGCTVTTNNTRPPLFSLSYWVVDVR